MSTALLRRRGVARVTGVLASSAVACAGFFAATTTASAEETVTETLQTFAADAFASQADELPSGLVEAIQRDLGISPAEYLANAAAAKSAADVVAELEAAGVSINGSVIAGQDLTVYVDAEADVPLVESVGANVEIGEAPNNAPEPDEQGYEFKDDFKGGYGYATFDNITNPTYANRCSAGFNATSGDGSPIVYTAGHCGVDYEEGHPWYHLDVDSPLFDDQNWTGPELTDRPLGENGPMHLGEGQDGGLINVTESGWTLPPQVAYWGGGTGAPDDGESVDIYDSTDAIVGQPACKSGATSGWTCGEILSEEETVEIGLDPEDPSQTATVTAFIFNACMLSGDSGGSIVSGHYALGVNSFSNAQDTNTCDAPNWDPEVNTGGGYAVTSGSTNAETLFGDDFNLSIHVGTPTVGSPEEGGTTGQTPTLEGSVQAAKGATVTIEIEDGPTVEGTVAANGSFSANVEEELEPGTYSYTATASHTAKGAAAATTSESDSGTFEVVESQVEDLAVESPAEGQTTGNARPDFTGTGQPGATVSLSVGGDTYGEAEVGEDGSWTITPESDLPVGARFDATVTQSFEDDTQEVTVADLGIEADDVTISSPEDGSTVAGDLTFEGTSFAGAEVGLLLEPVGDDDANSAGSQMRAQADAADDADDAAVWEGEFEIDGEGNWTFTPAEPLAEGDYTVTATATLEGGDPELTDSEASVMFTVANSGGDNGDESGDAGGAENGDEDLPDTGSSNTWMIFLGIGLLAAGGAAVAIRARRNSSTA